MYVCMSLSLYIYISIYIYIYIYVYIMLADLCIGPSSGEMPRGRGPCDPCCIILDSVFLVHLYSKVVFHPCDSGWAKRRVYNSGNGIDFSLKHNM